MWEIGNIPEKAHNLGVRPKPVLWEAVMNSQKLENLLNLSLDSTMEEREKSRILNVGFDREDKTW